MLIRTSNYVGSFVKEGDCPKDKKPEYAFIGRSNVGKSSLINYLLGRKGLAKVSKTPGKTQTINYFLVNEEWYLVDLPGYGYARVSQKQRENWRRMIESYLDKRKDLRCAFVLVDSNITPQAADLEFINWLGEKRIPFVVVFTKADKSKPGAVDRNVKAFHAALLESWNQLPPQFLTSAEKDSGKEDILAFIEQNNQL